MATLVAHPPEGRVSARSAPDRVVPWKLFAAEAIGTALLLAVGLSIVIVDFGTGSPMLRLLPDPALRRLLTGFLFGATGASIALSPLGKESGAHINPVVTLAFWLMGRLKARHALGYFAAQMVGAVIGSLPLVAWGRWAAASISVRPCLASLLARYGRSPAKP